MVECIAVKTGIAVVKRFAYRHMHTFVRSLAVGRLINSPGRIAVTGHRLSHTSLIDRCFQNVMHFTFTFVQPAVAVYWTNTTANPVCCICRRMWQPAILVIFLLWLLFMSTVCALCKCPELCIPVAFCGARLSVLQHTNTYVDMGTPTVSCSSSCGYPICKNIVTVLISTSSCSINAIVIVSSSHIWRVCVAHNKINITVLFCTPSPTSCVCWSESFSTRK